MGNRPEFYEVKRQFERIHFDHPIPASLGGRPVFLLDLAIGGARLLGGFRVKPASNQELGIEWKGKSIRLKCTVTRCTMQPFVPGASTNESCEIGVRIVESTEESNRFIHELIGHYVMLAIEEQRANWAGVAPTGPYVHMEGKSGRYRRCELFADGWKFSATTRPEQPLSGFTISADVPPRYLEMLCETYEKADNEGRRLTRILAELSINKAEGVPTRRYIP